MQISTNIFREYDIRGLVDLELTDDSVRAIARAFGTYAQRHGKKVLALGRDVRLSADRFHTIVVDALISTGCDVIDIGVVPTPLLYFSLFELPVDAGMMITASHNPSEYNGFKLCIGKETIFGQEIQKIRQMVEAEDFISGSGKFTVFDNIIGRYMDYVTSRIKLTSPIRTVVDCGNGTAALLAPELVRRLGCSVTELYCHSGWKFSKSSSRSDRSTQSGRSYYHGKRTES